MKKFVLFLALIFASNLVFADSELWDNYGDTNSYGQKAVSEQEFQKALESKKTKKKKDKTIPKGENFSQSKETEVLSNAISELPILLIPLNLRIGVDSVIPTGYYQIEGVKEKEKVFLKFYQAHNVMAKLVAIETDDDFEQTEINFVKLLPHGDYHVKIIYGGVDFNAYTIIETAE